MFKLAKWAFKLGQQTERQRIEGILNSFRNAPQVRHSSFSRLFPDDDKKKSKFNLEVDKAVNYEINNIIDRIVEPMPSEGKVYSLLYPQESKDE